jgi:NTE family protein
MPASHPTTPPDSTQDPLRTALVLGGGGSAGNAWLIGVVAGLHAGGVDVTSADLVIGTSAGATAAAQLTQAPPDQLYADVLAAAPQEARPVRPAGASGRSTADHLERTAAVIAASSDPADLRRRMGAAAMALAAASDGDGTARWRAIVASRLPSPSWPDRRLLVTAVDAATGEPTVFERSSGVDLVDAVAASCSSGAAYRIDERWFVDGGYRSNADNADLAAGAQRVLVLSPFGGATRTPPHWRQDLATQVAQLRADGSDVVTVVPDDAARAAFGDDAMDPSSRPPAARAGFAQGRDLAAGLSGWWAPGGEQNHRSRSDDLT